MQKKTEPTIADNHVFKEMETTEKSYNQSLDFLENVLERYKAIHPVIADFKKQVTFLKAISDELLGHAEKAVQPDYSAEDHKAFRVQRIQSLKAFFQAYKEYAILYNSYHDLQKNQPALFIPIESHLSKHCPRKWTLASYLIIPIQRGPRYQLLAKEIKKMPELLTETNVQEFKELESLIVKNLDEINKKLSLSTQPSADTAPADTYWFAKMAHSLLWGDEQTPSPEDLASTKMQNSQEKETRVYQFGDLSRGAASMLSGFFTSRKAAAPSSDERSTVKPTASAADDDFVLLDLNPPKEPEDKDNNHLKGIGFSN